MTTDIALYNLKGFVTYASVPPLWPMPTVMFWGERTFMRAGSKFVWRNFRFVPRYTEASVCMIADQATPRDKLRGGQLVVSSAARRSAEALASTAVYELGQGIG